MVTLTIPPGYSMIANPYNHGNNTVTELFPDAPATSQIIKWDNATEGFSVNQFEFGAWTHPDQTLAPGEGAFFLNPEEESISITFEGTVPDPSDFGFEIYQGVNLVSVPPNFYLNALPLQTGDMIWKFAPEMDNFEKFTYSDGSWSPESPSIGMGESFYYITEAGEQAVPRGNEDTGKHIYFNNLAPGVDAKLFDIDGVTPLDSTWRTQLLVDSDNGFVPAGDPLPFLGGSGAGYIDTTTGGVVTIPGTQSGDVVTVIMRDWNVDNPGIASESMPLEIEIPPNLMPPANLVGLQSFSLVGGGP